jgi:hypothetical protein
MICGGFHRLWRRSYLARHLPRVKI